MPEEAPVTSALSPLLIRHLSLKRSANNRAAGREDRLRGLATRLRKAYSVDAEPLPADLANGDDLARVEETLKSGAIGGGLRPATWLMLRQAEPDDHGSQLEIPVPWVSSVISRHIDRDRGLRGVDAVYFRPTTSHLAKLGPDNCVVPPGASIVCQQLYCTAPRARLDRERLTGLVR